MEVLVKMEPYISNDNVKLAKPIWLNPLYLRIVTLFTLIIYLTVYFFHGTGSLSSTWSHIQGSDKLIVIFLALVVLCLMWLSAQNVVIYETYIRRQYLFGLFGSQRYNLTSLSSIICYQKDYNSHHNKNNPVPISIDCIILNFMGDKLALSSGFINLQEAFDYIHAKYPTVPVQYKTIKR
jgi:hypothetical protein